MMKSGNIIYNLYIIILIIILLSSEGTSIYELGVIKLLCKSIKDDINNCKELWEW